MEARVSDQLLRVHKLDQPYLHKLRLIIKDIVIIRDFFGKCGFDEFHKVYGH